MKNIIIVLLIAVLIGAIIYHWKRYQHYGSVTLNLSPTPAVLGQGVYLTVKFQRGVQEGELISGGVLCLRKTWLLNSDDTHNWEQETEILWQKEFSSQVQTSPEGMFAVFSIELPSNIPQSTGEIASPISSEQKVKPEIALTARFNPPRTSVHSGFEFEFEVRGGE